MMKVPSGIWTSWPSLAVLVSPCAVAVLELEVASLLADPAVPVSPGDPPGDLPGDPLGDPPGGAGGTRPCAGLDMASTVLQ